MAGNKPGKNIIQKQTIELHYNGSADGLALQQQLGNWCHEKLLPAMGMVLDESAQDSLYIKIENIQIETSITGTGDWLPILLQRIIEQFKDKINATPDIASQKAELVHHISPDENFRELLFYFLQYGYLPWWGAITSKEEFNNRLEEWLQQAPDGYPEAILPLLNNQLVRKRIVSQFTDKAFALFIARLLKVQPPEIVTILEDLPVISRSISASAEQVAAYNFKEKVLENLAHTASENITAGSIESWQQQAVTRHGLNLETLQDTKFYSKEFNTLVENIKKNNTSNSEMEDEGRPSPAIEKEPLSEKPGNAVTVNGDGEKIKSVSVQKDQLTEESQRDKDETKREEIEKQLLADESKEAPANPGDKEVTKSGTMEGQPLAKGSTAKLKAVMHKESTDLSKPITKMLAEGIYINNAGLVIVASFLPLFFKRLVIAEEGIIRDADAAVCLTNFLATGNESMAEFELVLPKILCGLSPEFVIDTNIQFDDARKKEAEELLTSVIEYWSILKNTSVEGLRETFLQRAGKLTFRADEWLLQVEQKQFDMLLGHLPWNISMTKHSWMPHLLRTEWV